MVLIFSSKDMIVSKDFSFAAAHFLTKYHGKCERLHGHNYILRISVKGPVAENGMVIDFVLLKKLVKEKIIDRIDHRNINDILENPTAERLVQWIWKELSPLSGQLEKFYDDPNFPIEIRTLLENPTGAKLDPVDHRVDLFEIVLWETPTSFVSYRGEDENF